MNFGVVKLFVRHNGLDIVSLVIKSRSNNKRPNLKYQSGNFFDNFDIRDSDDWDVEDVDDSLELTHSLLTSLKFETFPCYEEIYVILTQLKNPLRLTSVRRFCLDQSESSTEWFFF